ncbi:MAG: ATP-dependent DNA helicase RecQ [Bdellovibrionales bacterium]|nr:ATP-dependent DNA helicase RecQ [Bdellovibrionales bacterium]
MEALQETARQAGFFPLRESQERALRDVCAGRNLLIVWPTGSGKSLCYQLPALHLPGLTVVVSPLIALMDDQTAKARALKWPFTCVHSGLTRENREKRLRLVADGKIKLLYVTPERFRQEEFRQLLAKVPIALLAVDEAHCISQWGHDFRPDYSRLGAIRQQLGNPPVIALTATATHEVQADILKQLAMGPDAQVLWAGVERPNLHLAAEEFDERDDKEEALLRWLSATEGPKIVYFTLISTLEKVSENLRAKKFAHDVYHGDLDDGRRRQSLKRFLAGESRLMLATPAFGLGVDKPDIRGVLHFEIPGSLEAYFQEVGRAGRDGAPSHCQLLYVQQDLETQMRFIETLTPDPAYIQSVYNLLLSWKDRLNVLRLDDLREQLSFKNKKDFRLETALSFLDRWEVIRYPQRRLDRLEFVRPLTGEDLAPELWQARRLQLQKKLMALVQWFRSPVCRKIGIYAYFGWPDQKPCGFCDRCDEAGV